MMNVRLGIYPNKQSQTAEKGGPPVWG